MGYKRIFRVFPSWNRNFSKNFLQTHIEKTEAQSPIVAHCRDPLKQYKSTVLLLDHLQYWVFQQYLIPQNIKTMVLEVSPPVGLLQVNVST